MNFSQKIAPEERNKALTEAEEETEPDCEGGSEL